jgi:peptidoglycan hydrolase-like protein with peptidoglycan-binding domain
MLTRNRAVLGIVLFVLGSFSVASALGLSAPVELHAVVPPAAATSSATSSSASISALQALVATLESELQALVAAKTSTTVPFTRMLMLGATGSDVSALQQVLMNAGFYTYPSITGYFGASTEAAVAAYQGALNLDPVGYVGPLTRALLNDSNASSPQSAPSTPVASISPAASSTAATTPTTSATSTSAVPLADGTLSSYSPGYGGGGGGATAAPADTTPPIISSVVATSISTSTETISWTTNEAATTQVNYGLTTSYGTATSSAALVTSHSIVLTSLTASSTYDFQVSSVDASNNLATSGNQTFSTSVYDYYVDSVNGSDANRGTSFASAFQNLTALPTIANGQKICLVDGSYWRQSLSIGTGSPLINNVTVSSCGSGAAPIIDGADQIASGSWSKTTGFTNLYQTTEPFGIGSAGWINFFDNGSFYQNVASQATADATTCSYYISDMTVATGTVYIHTCDGSNPASNGHTYEYTHRLIALQIWGNNETVTGISTKRAANYDGSIVIQGDGSSSYVANCTADLGSKHNMFVPGGSTVENCSFTDAYYPVSGNMFVAFDQVGSGLPVTVRDSTFTLTQNIPGNVISAAFFHTGSGSLGTVDFENDTLSSTGGGKFAGISGQNSSLMIVNHATSTGMAYLANALVNTNLTNSKYKSSFANNNLIGTGASGLTLNVTGNQACVTDVSKGTVTVQNTGVTVNLTGNTFYLQATQSFPIDQVANLSTGLTLNSNNNIFDSAHVSSTIYDMGASGGTFTGDNNAYVLPDMTTWDLNGSTFSSLAAWQATTSPDVHSVTTGSGASACN